eukprot:907761-Amorphochlora_amoeboformis.AAC.1
MDELDGVDEGDGEDEVDEMAGVDRLDEVDGAGGVDRVDDGVEGQNLGYRPMGNRNLAPLPYVASPFHNQ